LISPCIAAVVCSARQLLLAACLDVKKLDVELEQHGQADKVTRNLRNRIRRKKTKAYDVAHEMRLMAELGKKPEWGMKDEQVKEALKKGELPEIAGLQGSMSEAVMHGKGICMTSSDVDRCQEEIAILEVEMARLRSWVSIMLNRVLTELQGQDAVQVVQWLRADQQTAAHMFVRHPAAGRQYSLHKQYCMLQELQEEAGQGSLSEWLKSLPKGKEDEEEDEEEREIGGQ
jgi:hypothetical protein